MLCSHVIPSSGFGEVVIDMTKPLNQGKFVVQPTQGTEDDVFAMEAELWEDDPINYPLLYAFFQDVHGSKGEVIWLREYSTEPLFKTNLYLADNVDFEPELGIGVSVHVATFVVHCYARMH